jgi:hypothetical protein
MIIENIFDKKIGKKFSVFLTQNTAKFCNRVSKHWLSRKTPIFSAENWRKLQKKINNSIDPFVEEYLFSEPSLFRFLSELGPHRTSHIRKTSHPFRSADSSEMPPYVLGP